MSPSPEAQSFAESLRRAAVQSQWTSNTIRAIRGTLAVCNADPALQRTAMSKVDVYLVCSVLEKSVVDENWAQEVHYSTVRERMVEQTLFGHWQIECHAILYEIKARGSFWTKKLEAVPSPKNKSRRKVYYRKKIGEIRYSAKETGERGMYCLVSPQCSCNR
jgi:hypothetical protein